MPRKATPLYEVYAGEALDDLAYEALGRRYDRRDFFKGTGVSMHTSKAASWRIARVYRVGSAVATLDIRHSAIVWARTEGRDHITVWAPGEILLECVVQCDGHE